MPPAAVSAHLGAVVLTLPDMESIFSPSSCRWFICTHSNSSVTLLHTDQEGSTQCTQLWKVTRLTEFEDTSHIKAAEVAPVKKGQDVGLS